MGKITTIILGLFLIANTISAQTSATENINAIKLQTEVYVYAESTSAAWEEALDFAKVLLKENLKDFFADSNADSSELETKIASLVNNATIIEARRGTMYRAFLYVPKSEIAPLPVPTPQVPEQEVHTKPNDNDLLDEFIPLDEIEEVAPIKEELQRTPLEEKMLTIRNAQDIAPFIKGLDTNGQISRFGKYADMPSDTNCYLFVYDRNMQIPAYLRKEGSLYINLKTGQIDDVKNYKGCGAIWFRLKY